VIALGLVQPQIVGDGHGTSQLLHRRWPEVEDKGKEDISSTFSLLKSEK
jgi:hypothetical protein